MDYFRKYQNEGYQLATYTPVTKDEAYTKASELRMVGHKTKIVRGVNNTYTVLAKPKGSNKKLKNE